MKVWVPADAGDVTVLMMLPFAVFHHFPVMLGWAVGLHLQRVDRNAPRGVCCDDFATQTIQLAQKIGQGTYFNCRFQVEDLPMQEYPNYLIAGCCAFPRF